MSIFDLVPFQYCPNCGQALLRPHDAKSLACASCGFVYYHGTAAVAVALVEFEDKIILTRRAREPQKGFFALPGGFVDYDETLEDALVRELQEELNLAITAPNYLCSQPDRYLYRQVVYCSIVAFFVVRANDLSEVAARDDISDFMLVRPGEIDPAKMAFESHRAALQLYQRNIRRDDL